MMQHIYKSPLVPHALKLSLQFRPLFLFQNEESEDTSVITLRVNAEQRDTIIQFINFNEWELDEMLCEGQK
jgi:hypothetical protein